MFTLGSGAVFRLDEKLIVGDDAFEDALVLPVAGEERLVGEHEDHVAQVTGEAAGEVDRVVDMQPVLTAEPEQPLADDGFADTLEAAHHDGDLTGFGGVLHHAGEPADDIAGDLGTAAADDGVDVIAHQRPVARGRVDGPAAPQVEGMGDGAGAGGECDAAEVLAATGITEPPLAE